MKKIFTLLTLSSVVFITSSSLVTAQASGIQAGFGTFADVIKTFNTTVVQALGTLFMSGAVVAFFFGVAKFVWGLREGNEKVITDGKQFMIWSLVGLFTMFSVYGIITFFQKTLLPGSTNSITIPDVNYGGGGSGSAGVNPPGQAGAYTCPDGITKYDKPSDFQAACNKTNPGQVGGENLKANGDQCTLSSQCSSGNCQSGPYGSQCAIPLP